MGYKVKQIGNWFVQFYQQIQNNLIWFKLFFTVDSLCLEINRILHVVIG